jgi:hypothetical protein
MTPGLQQELQRTRGLALAARRAKTAEALEALELQQDRQEAALQGAKVLL